MVAWTRSRAWRRWCWVLPGSLAAAACDRPSYDYADTVPVTGAAASTSFGGSLGVAGTAVGGKSSIDPCAIDRSVSAAPILAKQTVSNQLPLKPQLYAELSDGEVEALEGGGALIPASAPAPPGSVLASVLTGTLNVSTGPAKLLLQQLQLRFKATRSLWPNAWALRLVEHPGSEHMNPVRVVLKPEAWVVRIYGGAPPTVIDLNNAIVPIEQAAAQPERVAAVYYVYDNLVPGTTAQCEKGKRELALGNEAMVDEFSLGTSEILARLDSDIQDLTALLKVVRPCVTVERGSGSFQSNTACQTWRFFDASTEYTAYQWALSNPTPLYEPTSQNLGTLIDALANDRFALDPFVAKPPVSIGAGGDTGAAGEAASAGAPGQGGAGGAP